MSKLSLAEQLQRATAELAPPPGESAATGQYARQAVTLVACLRYSGIDDNDLQNRLTKLDRAFVTDRAQSLKHSDARDAAEAAALLDDLLDQTDVEVDQVIAVASVGVSGTY